MKKFRFQLETLLKVTRMKKEEAEVAFAKAVRALEEERAYQRQLLEEMAQGQRDYEKISKEGTHIKIGRLMSFNQFFGWKRQQIEDQQQVILRANAVRQKALKVLMEQMSALKSIEKLREKRLAEYKAEALREEQKMLDEIGLQLTMRNREWEEAV
ncbi:MULTISPECIES: flagellar export protein FliJ [Selenomonas]|uniref:flagellar export protein FliJ n=1 Tax=Selenomonas TaxID=970 RepID=UPI0001E0AFA5|nr:MULTISPECIES: flagellar export protein FliJ [Selenomonas]AKT53285.1 flagellar export protein FliJ [Selenomonas sp. oral taxon 478]AME04104.1 flagellar export protein FliJ [Selenomonas sp. oral taxon 136]EFM22244.1 flagellar export protein FliJ [Selenomonas sp. oral taxon 149 str. 67H29BP]